MPIERMNEKGLNSKQDVKMEATEHARSVSTYLLMKIYINDIL
jgi:hypothetical protein